MPDEYDVWDQTKAEARDDPLPGEPITELGHARRLIAVYGDRLRYVLPWSRWLYWDGRRWVDDRGAQAYRWQKAIARRLTTEAMAIPEAGQRRALEHLTRRAESSAGVAGALKLASTEAEVAIVPEDLDAHPHLLNCVNGVLDLRLAELRPHDPGLLLTKMTGASYDPAARGVRFSKFLESIQPAEEMRSYLARLLGYALAGEVADHLLPIFWGAGANGKSTLVNATSSALGDYAAPADPDLLTARSFDSHPTGVADLFGLRLAVLHETDRGRRLAEGTVKRLTGGDPIKARRMREDFWWFTPSHTFVMLTNHKPVIAGTEEALWRRLRLVPFDVIVPEAERDADLSAKLAGEADAVLAWLVAGHTAWRGRGLADPQAVTDATADYRSESDALGRFIEERCFVGPNHRARSSDLYAAWRAWCAGEGLEAGSGKAFSTAVENLGYDKEPTRTGVFWKRLGLAARGEAMTGDGM